MSPSPFQATVRDAGYEPGTAAASAVSPKEPSHLTSTYNRSLFTKDTMMTPC